MTRTTYILNGPAVQRIAQADAFAVYQRGTALVNGKIGAAASGTGTGSFLETLASEGFEWVITTAIDEVGAFIGNLFSAAPSQWESAGAGVHDWFTAYGPQAFLDWMRANQPNAFGSIDRVLGLYAFWLKLVGRVPILPRDGIAYGYKQGVTEPAYAAMGMDYPAMIAADAANPPTRIYILTGSGAASPAEVSTLASIYATGGRQQLFRPASGATSPAPTGATNAQVGEAVELLLDGAGSIFATDAPIIPPPANVPDPDTGGTQPTTTDAALPSQTASIAKPLMYAGGAYVIGKLLKIF